MEKTEGVQSTIDFYILAGQSNMDGEGIVRELPKRLDSRFENAWIYSPNRLDDQQPVDDRGFWEALQPGHGSGYSIDGSRSFHSGKFGPELSFAAKLLEIRPEHKVLIYKYAKGGSSIHPDAATDWAAGIRITIAETGLISGPIFSTICFEQ